MVTLDGVAQVNIFGQKRFAVRVRVQPDALAARNISLDELTNAREITPFFNLQFVANRGGEQRLRNEREPDNPLSVASLKSLLRYVYQTKHPLTFPLSGPGSGGMPSKKGGRRM